MTINWEEIQTKRLKNIKKWYRNYFQSLEHNHHYSVVRYIVLWAVFNAIYNLAYLPKRKAKSVKKSYGHRIPVIRFKSDSETIRKFAIHLSQQQDFIDCLITNHKKSLSSFDDRKPNVKQPHEEIEVTIQEKLYTFKNNEFKGIASIDNRLYLEDGSVLYQYAPFDFKDQNGSFEDSEKSIKQLLFFLYQLRNNIVHGGSAFIATEDLIANDALPILQEIVDYLFENSEVIMSVTDE